MKRTLWITGFMAGLIAGIGGCLLWPAFANEPIDADADSVWISPGQRAAMDREITRGLAPPCYVTWAELDSILSLYVLPLRPAADDPGVEWVDPDWSAVWDAIARDTGFYRSHPAWLAPLRQGGPYSGVTVEGR